jgi:nucleotide-binding universal stress UspA family protein
MSILCATDLSSFAQAAADVAALLAKKLNLPLRLMHCAQDYIVMGDLPVVMSDDRPLIEQLEAEADRLRATGAEVIEEMHHGNVVWEIVNSAQKQPTQLIVLGSVGKSATERWLVGSITESIAETAPVPTLVVRRAEDLLSWLEDGTALEVLCGIDLVGSSEAAIAWVRKLAAVGQVKVGAAYVQTVEKSPLSQEQHVGRQRDVWEQAHAALGDLPLTVHVREAFADPAHELLQFAETQKAALLVIGAHQRHGLQRLTVASFSRRVLTHARANVLCVPGAPKRTESVPSIHRVLLATDLDALKVDLLRYAHSLLPAGGEIRLMHVCHEPSRGVNPVIASEVYFDHSLATAEERAAAEKQFKELPAALLNVPGVKITSEILTHHDIAAAICDAAERFGADVICMGTKGHSRVGVALLGSTVQAVIAQAHKPVFVVTRQHV